MEDPTIEFNLITFQDLKTALYSTSRISRAVLRNRIIFARTNQGNYAKFQVQSGDDLRISRLTVYNPDGCIIKTAFNLTIRSSYSCDLDNARELSTGADFWWHGISPGIHYIEPQNAASFHLYKGFEEITFEEVRNAEYFERRVERPALREQVIFCRTSQGRYAKLFVEAGDTLIVRRLVVYNTDGRVHLDQSNINIPRTWTLDVDTGNVGASGYDLWWQAETATRFFLTPANRAAISYSSYFRFEKYLPLLRNTSIRSTLAFTDSGGNRRYDTWSEAEKLHLREFLYLRETGRDFPIFGPPVLTNDRFMSACDAWKIYLAHVAQSLWVDANSRVSWRLSEANSEYLEHLFDMRKLISFGGMPGRHSFERMTMGAVTHWNPVISYNFLVDEEMVSSDQWGTIKAITDWCRANLIHITGYAYDTDGGPFASEADQYQYIYGYRGLPLVDKMIYPLPGRRHITAGCWGTDGFLAAVLRTVNIPVRHGRTNFSGRYHSRPEFFTVEKNLAHGDDPYNGWVRLGHNNVPIERIFYDNSALFTEIDSPAPLPGKTVPETASFNASRRQVALAVEFKTDYLLRFRCQDRSTGATGTRSQMWNQLHEYYADAQIDRIVAECDAAIAAIPGGCSSI